MGAKRGQPRARPWGDTQDASDARAPNPIPPLGGAEWHAASSPSSSTLSEQRSPASGSRGEAGHAGEAIESFAEHGLADRTFGARAYDQLPGP